MAVGNDWITIAANAPLIWTSAAYATIKLDPSEKQQEQLASDD